MGLTQVTTGGIKDATITTADLADSAITNAKIAGDAVRNASIRNGSIDDDAVVADAAIAGTKITPSFGSQNIITTGKIGVGTTSPSGFNANADDLVISGSGNAGITIDTPNTNIGRIAFGDPEDNNTGQIRYSHANNELSFDVNASERMRITSNGNVGIGTTSPLAPLHVVSDANNMMQLISTDRYSTMYLVDSVGSTFIQGDSGVLRFGVGGGAGVTGGESEAMRIGSTGLVGIGTNSPATILHLKSTTADCDLQVQSTATNGDARLNLYGHSGGVSQIRFGDQDDANVGLLTYEHTNNSMQFRVGDVERMRIDASGNIGIGTTSASTKFEVQTASNERIQFLSNGANEQPRIDLTRDSGTDYSIINAIGAYVLKQNSDEIYQYSTAGHRFYIGGTEKARLKSDGHLELFDGDLKVASGHGIDFSATANGGTGTPSELLDDYEEGAFQPGMTFGGGNTNMSLGSMDGKYTKIGRHVFCHLRFNMVGKGSDTGILEFTGLPFAISDIMGTTAVQGGFPIGFLSGHGSGIHEVFVYAWEGGSVLKAYKRANQNSGPTEFQHSDIVSTFDGRIVFSYMTTS